MQKWQYMLMIAHLEGLLRGTWKLGDLEGWESIQDRVNEWGKSGWELVSAAPEAVGMGTTQSMHLWFKRPIPDSATDREGSPS